MVNVDLTNGTVRGSTLHGVARFLGIPYAAPPVGELRMRPPAPPAPWAGIRDALSYGPTAPRGEYPEAYRHIFPEPTIAGDEYLNLNVWAPEDSLGSPERPVLVFIHGGAFTNGSGAVTGYDGTSFARDGVVCVTLNYRLGVEGFLFTSGEDGTANLGLQDQIAALSWVRANIAAFGGDPTRVTVAGQSAGAMGLSALLTMPTAEGLFQQAILQSGAASTLSTPNSGLTVAQAVADVIGVELSRESIADSGDAAAITATTQVVDDMLAAPDFERWGELALTTLPFAPVIDGTVVPRHPLEASEDGAGNSVRVLVGTNAQDARLFLVAPGMIDFIDDTALLQGAGAYGLSSEIVDAYRSNYSDTSPGDTLARIVTDWYYRIPAIRLAEAREKGGATTWVYRFDHAPENNGNLGAAHAVELPFVFDTAELPELAPLVGPAPSAEVAGTAHATWVRFATDGDPGWPAYTSDERDTGLISASVTVARDPDAFGRSVWEGLR